MHCKQVENDAAASLAFCVITVLTNRLFYIVMPSDIARLYKLLKHIPRGLQAMVTELEEHITKTGTVILKNSFQLPFSDERHIMLLTSHKVLRS